MTKKVTLIIGSLGGGGAERVCVNLANYFNERGLLVDLVCINLNLSVRQGELSGGVNLVNLDVEATRWSLPSILAYIRKNNPKVVLCFNRQISVILIFLKLIFRLNLKVISRNIIFLSQGEKYKTGFVHGFVSKVLTKTVYPKSDVIIAQSLSMKEDIVRYLNVDPEKVVVIHNPIPDFHGRMDKVVQSNIERDNYILFVGRLEHQKAVHNVIYLFVKVKSLFPDLRLKIVGEGSLECELKRLCVKLNVENHVEFSGYVSNMEDLYVRAKATILTSLYEGFPNVLVESVSFGTPVVSFDCPSGPSEIIVQEKNGYLVPQGDIDGLAQATSNILLGDWDRSAVARSLSHLDMDIIGREYMRLFDDLGTR